MDESIKPEIAEDTFWRKAFFSKNQSAIPLRRRKKDLTAKTSEKVSDSGEYWLTQLFEGKNINQNPDDGVRIYKNGVVVYEIPLADLARQTLIGRHPDADLQLESHRMAMYHAVIINQRGKIYIESLDADNGILLNRKKLLHKHLVRLRGGMVIDFPGYRFEFAIADSSVDEPVEELAGQELDEIPEFFYTPPPPPPSQLLVNLVENREQICVWNEGTTVLKVADIIEETQDCKTFRLAGEEPILFSYRPGQFITFLLTINDQEIKRSYSMSSSPSRPHLLEVTIKRVPGGLVSNWFCDQVKIGDTLKVKGPSGKFTCFNYPANKMLFIGAGSGITPIVSMCRWISDTAADVDVKLLASFKSPGEIIFRKEFEMLSARSSSFQVAVTVTSGWQGTDFWTGFTGRVNEQILKVFVPDILERDIFLCGPPPFALNIEGTLRDIGFDMARFHTESFGSGRSSQESKEGTVDIELQGPQHQVTFTKSGKTVATDENITLLELAEAHGIELDYSCRVGSCGECEVKCRGEVLASENCEIDEKTKAAGFVYSCCCTAKTDLELEA